MNMVRVCAGKRNIKRESHIKENSILVYLHANLTAPRPGAK
jgi:hypothetical protein